MGIAAARQSTEQIHRLLRTDVLTAVLRPGEAMSEARMAVRFGVSRTPVREAFKRLVEEGFLMVVPQVGTFVAPIDLASVHDSQFVRETLECRTVVLAAKHIDDAGKAALEQHVVQQERDLDIGDRAGFFEHDDQFHAELARLAGHPSVWSLIEGVKAQLDRVRCLSLESAAWPGMILRQHREIAEAVITGNEAAAEKAMRAHLRTVFDAIQTIAQSHVDAFAGTAPPLRLD
ncbi:GntR family transcriptional regulator [Bosea lathyri]|jgi:DNA-binding GntR family transcriptional regulator|uniref:DNA-binding transcriptional regulator, GntR family n=1 Tax=Bosea lathyri TaxID=1036778 RepID=A0A1H6C557_9HYPH|nr:GntR family transcriptional regulator [Bosea lathyri]SEG68109.1 DNA-binding transcriptional regulator, GntR family [Bosea lathyri]